HTTDLVRLVPALEQLQRKESPRFPRQFLQLREVVQTSVVERERFRFKLRAFIASLLMQIQHSLLHRVNGKLTTINPDPAATQLLRYCAGRTAAGKGVEDDVAFI